MKTLKIQFTFLLLIIFGQTFAQEVKMDLSNLKIMIDETTYLGNPFSIALQVGKTTNQIAMFSNEKVNITATYHLSSFQGVLRSNNKKTSIKLTIKYVFEYHGKKVKKSVERFYYLDNDRSFDEIEKAAFMEGIHNTVISIAYHGKLPE